MIKFLWFLVGAAAFALGGGLCARWHLFWGTWVLVGAFVWFALPQITTWVVNGTLYYLFRHTDDVPRHLEGR